MYKHHFTAHFTLAAILTCAAVTNAFADCGASATPASTRKAYNQGLQQEKAGDLQAAFYSFVAAQEATCEANPIESDAARHAAALALKLGAAAEKSADYERAFDIYDTGGQYAAADRALMSLVRAQPDDPRVYNKARSAFDYRTLPAFASNQKVQLSITGTYLPDPKNMAEVLAMPPKAVERAFKKEAAAFNETYLREYVQLIQSRPDDPTDLDAMQAALERATALAQKYPQDLLKPSREALSLVQSWAGASIDRAWADATEARRAQRLAERVATLTKSYSGAPKLLDEALTYQLSINLDHNVNQAKVAAIRTQASKLGDDANAKQRLGLASEYYEVARQDAKAQAARDKQQQLAMARMQPSIDQMQKQAEAMRAQFSDPAKVKEMQEQARALQKSLQQQQQTNAKSSAKKADDLEKELGL
jgi:hypothetical protein